VVWYLIVPYHRHPCLVMSTLKGLIVTLLALGAIVLTIKFCVAPEISPNHQEWLTIRPLSEYERMTNFLYEEVGYDYKQYALIKKVIQKESEWNPIVYGDSGLAYSVGQFHRPTFNWFQQLSGIEGEYENPYSQIQVMVWAFDNGLEHHWSAYNTLLKKGLI